MRRIQAASGEGEAADGGGGAVESKIHDRCTSERQTSSAFTSTEKPPAESDKSNKKIDAVEHKHLTLKRSVWTL